ncbi:hypothetical protein PV327_010142 [Microctonus hyperodae]|uniref:RETREG1-3/ARL6IP-like N-terminal reticulon-homology domain-containing protein n=1 Tax=Microctonus hyperodae TaxID=165561 RepID=A0AA39FRW7_MICHY|nr:hypothetical protein PV327_010142 [Microctonus hyperodae]
MYETMEYLPKIVGFFRLMRQSGRINDDNFQYFVTENYNKSQNLRTSKKLCTVIESILLWENPVNSITVMVVFNMLFWSIVVLEVRGIAAASSAALVVVLGQSTLEARVKNEYNASNSTASQTKTLQIRYILRKAKNNFERVKSLRQDRPSTFCSGMCTLSIILWLIGRTINGVLITYIICMSILLGPVLLFKIPKSVFLIKEWDSEIDEFLPAVTDDSLKILKRAGDMGDRSPTPPSESSDNQIDPFNDNEFIESKMPSHDDGSTDGLDIFELELSYGESDVNCSKIQNAHFEENSSSEEEVELQLESKDLASNSDDDESDFEIIDGKETSNFGNI